MDISVVIPNLNSPIISDTLNALYKQDFVGSYEIIIVGKDKYKLITTNSRTEFIETNNPVCPAKARNIGIKYANGNIISFIDADCIPQKNWLSLIFECFRNQNINVLGGSVSFPSENILTYCDNLAAFYDYLPSSPNGYRELLPSLNLSLRKSILQTTGIYNERYNKPAGEDADFTTRIRLCGFALHFNPNITVIHLSNRRNLVDIFLHFYNYGRYSIKVDKRYHSKIKVHWVIRYWPTTLFLSPLLAIGVLIKIMKIKKVKPKEIPILILTKIAWCLGASATLLLGSPVNG